jgi:HupE / UreJ protein
LSGDSGPVALDPSWFQAARTFVGSGVAHILGGIDHLLFLLCLVLPLRNLKQLLPVVTSFTVAHSIALIASAQGLVPSGGWFPPLVEAVIAASIVCMAVANVIAPNLRHRWLVTGAFGIVHGFGFSYGLQEEFQLAGDHLLTSLFSFNLGIEIGQLIVLAVTLPALALLFRIPALARFGVAVASLAVGHTAWHWMTDRLAVFPSLEWPALNETTVAAIARALVVLMLIGAGVHVLTRRARRPAGERPIERLARADSTPEVMHGV